MAMLVWLIPVNAPGGEPTPPIYYPPGIWPPGFPTHPIAPGGPPPGIWPGPGYPAHPIAPGGPPPVIWPGPGYPAPPIYYPPYPSQPPFPTPPINIGGPPPWGIPLPPGIWPSPGYPAHPIAPGGPPPSVWPGPGRPDQGLPGAQPGVDNPVNRPPSESGNWTQVYLPGVGWVWAIVPPATPATFEQESAE
jgi:hypothetical protein